MEINVRSSLSVSQVENGFVVMISQALGGDGFKGMLKERYDDCRTHVFRDYPSLINWLNEFFKDEE